MAQGSGRDPFGPRPGPGPVGRGAVGPDESSVAVLPGLNQPGLGPSGSSPPDTTGAVGPSHYVELVNRSIAVYRKTDLAQVGPALRLGTFTKHPEPTENIFDPQVIWDPQSSRWYYLTARLEGPVGSRVAHLAYGWSQTADPTDLVDGWCHQGITTGEDFDDYPKLGDNDTHLVFGTNVFAANGTGGFRTSRVWTVPKPANGVTTCPGSVAGIQSFGSASAPLRTSDGALAFTPVPANTVDSSAAGHVVASNPPGNVMTWQVNSSGALVARGNVAVGPVTFPPDVPQPNSGCAAACDLLDSLDGRLTQAVSAKDPDAGGAQAVWTQHSIADPAGTGRSVLRWYELLPGNCSGGTCPASARRQQGEVRDPAHHVFNGAISPTTGGNAAVVNYNVGSATLTAEIRARSRLSTTPLGATEAEVTLGTSAGSLDDHTCGTRDMRASCRWGDYAGATPDPSNPRVVWGSNQSIGPVTQGSPHWRTRNFALRVNAPPTAAVTAAPNPAVTGQGVSFNGAASADPDGTIARYEWDLDGDGAFETDTGTTPTTSRTYAGPATLTVRLRVTDDDGGTGAAPRSLRVQRAPSASFTATPDPALTGERVSFDGSASADPDGTIVRYEWDLDGDGGYETDGGTTPTTSRTYATADTRQVRLRVTDDAGATAEVARALRFAVGRAGQEGSPLGDCPAATTNVINGTSGDDAITATRAGDRIFAGLGGDLVNGLAGDDCIDLGAGADRGDGGPGDDLILGGTGPDRLVGGAGADRLRGGAGNDSIRATDRRRDRISCGRGRDAVIADRVDRVARDCERVRRPR